MCSSIYRSSSTVLITDTTILTLSLWIYNEYFTLTICNIKFNNIISSSLILFSSVYSEAIMTLFSMVYCNHVIE